MRFMIQVRANAQSEAGTPPDAALLAAMIDYHEQLARAGALLDANGLQPSAAGWRLRYHQGRAQVIDLAVTLAAGESLVFEGGGLARSYDAKGRQKGVAKLDRAVPQLLPGRQDVSFECTFAGDTPPNVDVTFRARGEAEPVRATR